MLERNPVLESVRRRRIDVPASVSTEPSRYKAIRSDPSPFDLCVGQAELEEAIREGNAKFNKMITDHLQAQDEIRTSAELAAKVRRGFPAPPGGEEASGARRPRAP